MKSGDDCACVHFDRCECANMRYRRQAQDAGGMSHFDFDPCDCSCHDDYDEEQDGEGFAADA